MVFGNGCTRYTNDDNGSSVPPPTPPPAPKSVADNPAISFGLSFIIIYGLHAAMNLILSGSFLPFKKPSHTIFLNNDSDADVLISSKNTYT